MQDRSVYERAWDKVKRGSVVSARNSSSDLSIPPTAAVIGRPEKVPERFPMSERFPCWLIVQNVECWDRNLFRLEFTSQCVIRLSRLSRNMILLLVVLKRPYCSFSPFVSYL